MRLTESASDGMVDWERIDHPHYFARYPPHAWGSLGCEHLRPALSLLEEHHGIRAVDVFMTDIRCPDTDIAVSEPLPIESLQGVFPHLIARTRDALACPEHRIAIVYDSSPWTPWKG